jgi:hypothetical protein
MSKASGNSTFYNGQCLNMLCNADGPHYHFKNNLNAFNYGRVRSNSSNNKIRNNKTRKAILNAYVGINEKRAKKMNMKNTIKAWRSRNRNSAIQSLKNDRKKRNI